MMNIDVVFQRLVKQWVDDGLEVLPPLDPRELHAFEQKHGVVIPANLRAFLETANGLPGHVADRNENRLFPLEEYELARDHHGVAGLLPESESWFLFADHMIHVPVYAIRMTMDRVGPHPVMALDRSGEVHPVADSFTEFVTELLRRGVVP